MPESSKLPDLSPVQSAMLRHSLAEWSGQNIEQAELTFAKGITAGQIIAAWDATVLATDALRAGFHFVEDEPTDWVALQDIGRVHLESSSPACWSSWLEQDRRLPLPLKTGLPWRAILFPAAGKFIWTFHHALLDGRSIAKILRSFQARLAGAEDPGKLTLARWQPAAPSIVADALEFHRRAFAGIERSIPEYPLDVLGTPARLHRTLGNALVTGIEAAARQAGVTPATMITWAWGQAVATACGSDAAAIGVVRSGPPAEDQAGFAMNTVPLIIRRNPGGSVANALRDLRKHWLDLRAIESVSPQDLPTQVFQNAGGPWPGGVLMVDRGTMHHQVGATPEIESLVLHELSGEPLLAAAYIHPDMELVVETDGKTHGPQAAENLLDHWAEIISALAEQRSDEITAITRLSARMTGQLDSCENGGPPLSNLHLADLWRTVSAKHAQACAIQTPTWSLSYTELAARAEHLAARLHQAGVSRGTPVANLLRDRALLAEVLLAISLTGGIHVPLDPALPSRRLLEIIEDSQAALTLTDDPAACAAYGLPLITLDGETGLSLPATPPRDPGDTLAILYTSGSTGTPKGVIMTHGGVTNEAIAIAELIHLAPGDRLLQFSSPGFDTSLEELLSVLLRGATLVPRPEEIITDFNLIHDFLNSAEISILDLTTTFWAIWCAWMVSEKKPFPPSLRCVVIGGERLSAAAARDWQLAGGAACRLINSYGPTEASIVATIQEITDGGTGDPPIGKPLPGVIVRVADASGARLPPGAAGELWLGGHCISPGYWRKPDLSAAAFQVIDGERWYRTGDRAHWDEAGRLCFLGRCDDQLKIRGQRVEPGEVIRILESYPDVSAAHAGPYFHRGEMILAAWLRWKTQAPPDWPARLAEHASAHLPAAAIPVRWIAVDEFKLTERGKLDRKSLPPPTLTASGGNAFDPPATPIEKRLAEIWTELLGVERIGRDESFFELGGHSLAALRLFAAISHEWQIRIPMATLVQSPTPRLLAGCIEARTSTNSHAPHGVMVVPIRAEGHREPLFCIHGGDGGVIFYQNLATHLPPGRPLLAIEAPALGADEEVRVTPVGESAASYIKVLRQHQPDGPYHLAGYSYGGLLVYEMARQLRAAGETVAFAGLFDTVNPATPMREYSLLERAEVYWNARQNRHWFHKVSEIIARTREGIATHFRVKNEIRAARSAGSTAPHSDIRMLQVREAHWEAMMIYQPLPLNCHVTLFKTESEDDKFEIPNDYGWTGLAASLEIVEVPGQHLTMFSPRHAATLAREIGKRI